MSFFHSDFEPALLRHKRTVFSRGTSPTLSLFTTATTATTTTTTITQQTNPATGPDDFLKPSPLERTSSNSSYSSTKSSKMNMLVSFRF